MPMGHAVRPLRNDDGAQAREDAIDQAFAGVIAKTGTDLVNPLEHGAGEGDAPEATGDQPPPWMQPEEEAPNSSTPTAATVPSQIPAGERPMPGATSRPISRLNLAQLPADVRQYAEHLQREYDTANAQLQQQATALKQVGEYADVAQHLAQFPGLREHVRQWYAAQGGQQRPAAPAADPLDEQIAQLAQEDQQLLRGIESRLRKEYQTALEQRLAPFEQDRGRIQALTEEQEFLREYPEWQDFVDPTQLMRAKEVRPNEHLSTLFAALAMPVMVQRMRGGGQTPQRAPQTPPQQPAPRPVPSRSPALRLADLAQRVAPPTQPRSQPAAAERIVRSGNHAMDDAFSSVMERLQR